jgi:hypothetical protein
LKEGEYPLEAAPSAVNLAAQLALGATLPGARFLNAGRIIALERPREDSDTCPHNRLIFRVDKCRPQGVDPEVYAENVLPHAVLDISFDLCHTIG